MRGSGWVLLIAAVAIWLIAVAYPAVAFLTTAGLRDASDVEMRARSELLMTSCGWGLAVAAGAIVVGWIPGRVLGAQMRRRGYVPLAALMIVPICLPSYIVFFSWWQSWPADSAIHQWVVSRQLMQQARELTLLLGLLCWSWPLVAWCVAASGSASTSAIREDMLLLDGAGAVTIWIDRLRRDLPGLLLGGLLVFLATINNTTCFDLAEVFTFANELRAIEAFGANPRDMWIAGAPAVGIAALGAAVVWFLLAGVREQRISFQSCRASRTAWIVTACIWLVSVVLPLTLFTLHLWRLENGAAVIHNFFQLYGRSVFNTLMYAVISGTCAALAAIGLAAAWQDHRRGVRLCANMIGVSWIIMGIVPGTMVGVALHSAYAVRVMGYKVSDTPAILVIAHLASFGFAAVLLGRWMASEPSAMTDLRRVDGAQSLIGLMAASWPRLLAAGLATLAIVTVLAVGEIAVTAKVSPPHRVGEGPLALSLLNDMHYQRPQTVTAAALLMVVGSLIAALIVTFVWFKLARSGGTARLLRSAAIPVVMLLIFALPGCGPDDPDNVSPLRTVAIFGSPGQSLGQLAYPRAIDVDPQRNVLYVIDKQARVQCFRTDGEPLFEWRMPEMENGKPTGVSVAPDGRVFVADTHYFRVIAYDPQGNEVMRFGSYGRGPGEFIYTTDIAFGPEGRLYVAEYGGNDRVQVYSLEGEYLFEFGGYGSEVGQFRRPQALAFNRDKTELYIADACNHRIVVVDPEGTVLRTIGKAGRGAGELMYPYSLTVLDDGSILVCEFGNNRLQRLDAQGRCLGLYGRIGRSDGELQFPWAVARTDREVFVLDSGNHRVQVIRSP